MSGGGEVGPGVADGRVRALRALGDPIRLRVVDLLIDQDMSPDALSAAVRIKGNLLAHHLNVLERAGLVSRVDSHNDRRRTYVCLTPGALDGLFPARSELTAPRVVFVCTRNSARSVMAEALWRDMSGVPGTSAGTAPAPRFHPKAQAALRRAGVSPVEGGPRMVAEVVRPDDLVVSVCDAVHEDLPELLNPRLHWSIADPAPSATDAAFDEALTELRRRVVALAPHVSAA